MIDNNKKINVAIIFGGKSAEHEVSINSAKNIINALDKKIYNPILIKIKKSGEWILDDKSNDLVAIIPQSNGKIFNITKNKYTHFADVVFPVLHGPLGEDGTIQGLLKLANIPFVGAGVLGSAVGMDKDAMKRLLRDAKLPVVNFIALKNGQKEPSYEDIKKKLNTPFFIKPANMGSSVGVYKIKNEKEYLQGIKNAFEYDTKIIIEEFIKGREIECSVLGNSKITASVCGEIVLNHEFYSYETKYIDESGAKLEIPAKISQKSMSEIQKLAVKTFKTLSCEGFSRVDFFLKENGEVIINEINTIPGFTKSSMYPKLWETSGIPYKKLISKLINLAIERFKIEQRLKTNYL